MKEKLGKEKNDHQIVLSRVTILHVHTMDLAKREEVTLKVKEKVEK